MSERREADGHLGWTSLDEELAALKTTVEALRGLDPITRLRVLHYLTSRFGHNGDEL